MWGRVMPECPTFAVKLGKLGMAGNDDKKCTCTRPVRAGQGPVTKQEFLNFRK